MFAFYDAAANMHTNFGWIRPRERKMDSVDNVNNVMSAKISPLNGDTILYFASVRWMAYSERFVTTLKELFVLRTHRGWSYIFISYTKFDS